MDRKRVGWIAGLLVLLALVVAVNFARQALAAPQPTLQAGAARTVQANEDDGILVAAVEPGGPADEAGVVRGDILLEVDGTRVDDLRAVREAIAGREAGDEIELLVRHGDEMRERTLTLREGRDFAALGLEPCHHPEMVVDLRLPGLIDLPLEGIVVRAVEPGSPAAEAGLEAGDRIIAVDGEEVGDLDPRKLVSGYEPGDEITLTVERPGEAPREVEVVLSEDPADGDRAYLGARLMRLPGEGFVRRFGGGLPPFETAPLEAPFDMFPFDPGDRPFEHPLPVPDGANVEKALVVQSVAPESPAAEAGLRRNDEIVAIDGEPVESHDDLAASLADREPGDAITLTIRRGDGEASARIVLGEQTGEVDGGSLGIQTGLRVRVEVEHSLALPDDRFELGEELVSP